MKKILFLLLTGVIISCSTTNNRSSSIDEDKIFITRKYVGKFVDYRHTIPELPGMPNIIWIKTSMNPIYGKIAAYGKKCNFTVGDRLYIRRIYNTPAGSFGYWQYQIENNSDIVYSLSDYQYEKKVIVDSWFE